MGEAEISIVIALAQDGVLLIGRNMNKKPPQLEPWIQRIFCEPPVAAIRKALKQHLPETLFYHSALHTDDVIREVLHLGITAGLGDRSLELLGVAAAFHDAGFLESRKENEQLGAKMATEALKREAGSYTNDEIDLVAQMIEDTTLRMLPEGPRQVPRSKLSAFLCDADTANLGRDDFFECGERYRKELNQEEAPFYTTFSLIFMHAHRWNTKEAQALWGLKKELNLELLIKKAASYAT